jgi:hypothetical protein
LIGGDVGRANDLNCLLITALDENVRAANEYAFVSFYLQSLRESLQTRQPAPPSHLIDSIPSEGEFGFYYRMATQGLVYDCLKSYDNLEEREVRRILQAVVDHDLYQLLAVGRS